MAMSMCFLLPILTTILLGIRDGFQNFTKHEIATLASPYTVYAIDVDVLSTSGYGDDVSWYESDGFQNFTKHKIAAILTIPPMQLT